MGEVAEEQHIRFALSRLIEGDEVGLDAGARCQHGEHERDHAADQEDARRHQQPRVRVHLWRDRRDQDGHDEAVDRNHDVGLRVRQRRQVHVDAVARPEQRLDAALGAEAGQICLRVLLVLFRRYS